MANSCRHYDNIEDEKKALKVYKHWQINESEDEERHNLLVDY